MRRTASVLLATLALLALPTVAHAGSDSDGDARQDKQVLHAEGRNSHDLGGNRPNGKHRKGTGWGANACQNTGWDDPLQTPITHTTVNNFQLHVHWCLHDGQFTQYSVTPENGPSMPWTHWSYKGVNSQVVNRYNDRIYARYVGTYEFCVAWIFPYCVDKNATIHITVYSSNRQPAEGGAFSDGYN